MAVPRGRLGLLPDTPRFEPWLSAREVVDLARTLVAPARPRGTVAAALHEAGLGEAIDRRVGGFSRGMLQRLGLAATLVGEPELLLLDEPAAALDPLGRREVLDLIARERGRRTVILSSHILSDVQAVCDTVGILRAGALLYQGALHDLLTGAATPSYRVRVRAPAAGVADALRAEPWVRAVEMPSDGELRIAVDRVDDAERELAGALARAGARVVSVQPEEASLEQVFLELTR